NPQCSGYRERGTAGTKPECPQIAFQQPASAASALPDAGWCNRDAAEREPELIPLFLSGVPQNFKEVSAVILCQLGTLHLVCLVPRN
ncbi:MAG: hypothetical protein RL198_194, partial [Actinomycetota bacterium]